jgi:acetoin utilization deacetylase AcuC-like enzyme
MSIPCGEKTKLYLNVNVPLPMGICDEVYLEVFNKIDPSA